MAVDAVWTDPPYGVDYEGKTADALKIENDALDDKSLEHLLEATFRAGLERCKAGAAWYVAAPAGPRTHIFATVLLRLGIWRQTLVWIKDRFVLGHSDYHYRYEPIYLGYGPIVAGIGRRGRGGGGWYGDNAADTNLEVPRPSANREHPTMKPVELIAMCLKNSTAPGMTVADPFAGSGSTLIACHAIGRKARLIELDPRYADVICRRFQEHTGITPILEATGEPIDFTKQEG